ncbi:hypothetical protein MKW92_027852, partial [Papaver armeniacum]
QFATSHIQGLGAAVNAAPAYGITHQGEPSIYSASFIYERIQQRETSTQFLNMASINN